MRQRSQHLLKNRRRRQTARLAADHPSIWWKLRWNPPPALATNDGFRRRRAA
jgi:hypothetical protein